MVKEVAKMLTEKMGFIGAGRMGGALIEGILRKRLISPKNLWICDKFIEKLTPWKKKGAHISTEVESVAKNTDVMFIAVKPQDILEVLKNLKGKIRAGHLIVSIAAGITTSFIVEKLGKEISVVRTMPNTPALIGEGITAISFAKSVSPEQKRLLRKILGAIGEVIEIPEDQQDAVTGLSGSGPAYIYTVIKGLIKGGIKAGLRSDLASRLAIQTTLGAAKMAKESNSSLEELRKAVTSPRGTTMEGLKVLQERGLEEILAEAVVKATQRARQLNK